MASMGMALLILLGGLMPTAAAAGGNGLRVSPVRTDVTISPGQSKVVSINVTNITSLKASFQGVVNDFIASSDESGNPELIIDPKAYAPTHSLKRYVQPISNFTLAPGESKAIPVTINIPANAAGGGYYGAVRFAPASDSAKPGQNVRLAGSVGSLILVKVPGNITDKLTLASFDVRGKGGSPSNFFTSNKNLSATIRFQNEGNVQEQPFGKVLLKNRSGKILASYELNNAYPPANVLPNSIRRFSIPLSKIGGFGQYKLEGNFGYGTGGQLMSASTTFYVVPWSFILGFLAVVLLLLFLVFGLPRLVRAYNKRILRRAGRR